MRNKYMSWKKNNKIYNEHLKGFDVWYVKVTNPNIKKFRVRNWLKANQRRGIKK